MSASTTTIERPAPVAPVPVVDLDRSDVAATQSPRPRPGSRWIPVASMLAGGLVLLTSAGLVASTLGDAQPAPVATAVATAAPAGPLALTISGPGDVTVLHQVYEAGKDSGWHAHAGIHAVAVLSGTLTIYDEGCRRETFGPGQSYVGGQANHLVRNETAAPVDMVVTYMNPAGPHESNRQMAPPAGCVPEVAG